MEKTGSDNRQKKPLAIIISASVLVLVIAEGVILWLSGAFTQKAAGQSAAFTWTVEGTQKTASCPISDEGQGNLL